VRILYFSRDYSTHDHRFLAALAHAGHQAFFLRLERRGPQLEDRPLPPGVAAVAWAGGRGPARLRDAPRLYFSLRQVLARVRPDLVHAGPIQTAGLLAAASGFHPLVAVSWGSDLLRDADRNEVWRLATRFTLNRAQVLVGDCQTVRLKAEALGFPPERIVTFPWGVDLEHFSPNGSAETPSPEPAGPSAADLRARLGWQDAFVLLSTRGWEPVYGVEVLARAFVQAARQRPELRLVLLGGGSLAPALRRIFLQGGVLAQVHFGGQVSQRELPDLFRSADLYVSASRSDGSSISLLEALACGTPALVSDIPGNREWITPGEQGWWFPDGDAEALAGAMLAALAARASLPVMGRAARALAQSRADWDRNFQELLRAYRLAREISGK
jgi:glycosyltransferase involved in cell wall biosynthesis